MAVVEKTELITDRVRAYGSSVAVRDLAGRHTYAELLDAAERVAASLLGGRRDLEEERVAVLLAPGMPWVAAVWGVWMAGGVAVPLPLVAARPEWEYALEDTGAATAIVDEKSAEALRALCAERGVRLRGYAELASGETTQLPQIDAGRRAMILFTSGTTNKPKGVVTTHANITAQIESLVEAWEWSADDRIALFLPLHHVHGIINIVSCALWSGASVRMLAKFDAGEVWRLMADGELTLLMAVPTIYVRMIRAWEEQSEAVQHTWSEACRRMRLMVSGSAALPVSVLERWRAISGHTLLERYGMTEIGMAISNPLHGERVPGAVGRALPGVEVHLAGEDGRAVAAGEAGEIEVRGPNVFKEYWGKPEATRETFREGWFRTGDTAVEENGVYRILGRTSVDILKSGGHKISALEIEESLREHGDIAECAVVGVPDEEWGERVGVAVVLRTGCSMELDGLRTWARERMTAHKLPTKMLVVEALPRNAMGKVVKPQVTKLFAQKN